jgi:RNA polymerase sigma-70 factor (ECF subfamily)
MPEAHHNAETAHRAIERVARESYGRLVAYLSSHTRDVAGAEDALGQALLTALTTWPDRGVPQNPEAWLLTAARRSFIDVIRHQRVVVAGEPTLRLLEESSTEVAVSIEFPDERLKLLFVCAHPAIDAAMHTPLMLQTILGLDAARIADAFLVSPKTMGQRLVRAKTKIRDGGIRFEIPEAREWPERLDAVLEAIYAAFGISWDMLGIDQRGRDLAEDAIWLARVLLQLMPAEAEARGLLALMLHCEARRTARRGPDGRYIPLSEQAPEQWSLPLLEEAERHLRQAFTLSGASTPGGALRRANSDVGALTAGGAFTQQHVTTGRFGRFQLEAAIQSVHAERARSGETDWAAIALFYEQLIRISPALGTRAGYAAAIAEAYGPESGLSVLDAIDPTAVSRYQPYWAVRAHLLQRLGQADEASAAYDRAIGLAEDPAVRAFLLQRQSQRRG